MRSLFVFLVVVSIAAPTLAVDCGTATASALSDIAALRALYLPDLWEEGERVYIQDAFDYLGNPENVDCTAEEGVSLRSVGLWDDINHVVSAVLDDGSGTAQMYLLALAYHISNVDCDTECNAARGVCPPTDLCPDDVFKIYGGACGCGVHDSDTDGDGVYDCLDYCPSDERLATPHICGCNFCRRDEDCSWKWQTWLWDGNRWEGGFVACVLLLFLLFPPFVLLF